MAFGLFKRFLHQSEISSSIVFEGIARLLVLFLHVIVEDPLPFSVVTRRVSEFIITVNRDRSLWQLNVFLLVAVKKMISVRVGAISFCVDHFLILDIASVVGIGFDWHDQRSHTHDGVYK